MSQKASPVNVGLGALASAGRFLARSDGGLRSQLLRSGFWVAVSQVALNSLQLVRSVVLARLLTPDIFGLMAICITVTRGMELFSETGVRPALIHSRDRFEDARDTAFTIMVVRGFFLALVTSAIAPLAAWYYDEPRLTALVSVLSLSFIATGFSNPPPAVALPRKISAMPPTPIRSTSSYRAIPSRQGST